MSENKKYQLDSGVVFIDYGLPTQRELGETKGGSTLEIIPEMKDIEFDGQKGSTKGMKRKISENAKLTVNVLNLTLENLKLCIPGAKITANKLTSSWDVNSSYIENVTVISYMSDNMLRKYTIYNAMAEDGLNIPMVDKEESVVPINFIAHHEPGKPLWEAEDITEEELIL